MKHFIFCALVCCLFGTSPSKAAPPVLDYFDFTPTNFDNTASATVLTFTLDVTSDVGFEFGYVDIYDPQFGIYSTWLDSFNRVSGTAFSGTYVTTLTIPAYCRTGTWSVASVSLYDTFLDQTIFTTLDLETAGYPSAFEVTGLQDEMPPTLVDFQYSPQEVNNALTGQLVPTVLEATDDLSGFAFASGFFQHPSSFFSINVYIAAGDLVSGNPLNGVYEALIDVAPYFATGTWALAYLDLYDEAGNSTTYDTAALQGLGMPTSLIVKYAVASVSGTVYAAGTPLPGCEVRLDAGTSGWWRAQTDISGRYGMTVRPGTDLVARVRAARLEDQWHQQSNMLYGAQALVLGTNQNLANFNFHLAPGQAPALAHVTSSPTGATVWLDYWPETNVTDGLVDLGDVSWDDEVHAARKTISARRSGQPTPPPARTPGAEGEILHFPVAFAAPVTGSVAVSTMPLGAEVYVDAANAPAGVTPVTVTNLLAGPHVIFLKKAGYLQPMPVVVDITSTVPVAVHVPLAAPGVGSNHVVRVVTEPPRASIYVDYLATNLLSGAVVDWLDAASHAGDGWYSTLHSVMVRKQGYLPPNPRRVLPGETNMQEVVINLLPRKPAPGSDMDGDTLPDAWEGSYGLSTNSPAGNNGRDGDPDGDGSPNWQEQASGTDPTNGQSVIEFTYVAPWMSDSAGVGWTAVPGRSYLLQHVRDLRQPGTNVAELITGSSPSYSVFGVPAGSNGVNSYRLIVLP